MCRSGKISKLTIVALLAQDPETREYLNLFCMDDLTNELVNSKASRLSHFPELEISEKYNVFVSTMTLMLSEDLKCF